ncbi:MAG: hypothetical protein ACT4QE_09565 [Anaerolineales bacterium]
MLIVLMLAALGCGVISTSVQVTAIAVGPGTPLPPINIPVLPQPGNSIPTPVLPVIQLDYAGTRVASREMKYQWQSGAGSSVGGGGVNALPLTLPLGASLDIVVTHTALPALLVVTELDANGVPAHTTTLTPISLTTAYTPTQSGMYELQVLAQWTADNFVLAQFAMEVTP